MNISFENAFLHFELNPNSARWRICNRVRDYPDINNIQMNMQYHIGRKKYHSLNRWDSPSISEPERLSSIHGSLKQIQISIGPDHGQIHYIVTFALLDEHPLLLWRLSAENQGQQPIHIDKFDMFSAGFIYRNRIGPTGNVHLSSQSDSIRNSHSVPRRIRLPIPTGDYAFFSNGWQSWSYTGVYSVEDHYRSSRLGPLRLPVIRNPGTANPHRAGVFASDMFGVLGDRLNRSAVLLGFLSQKNHFGSIEALTTPTPALRMWANGDNTRLDPGVSMVTDWACLYFLHLDEYDPLGVYMDAVAREHNLIHAGKEQQPSPNDRQPVPTGWCSWYQFSTDDYLSALSVQNIQDNLDSASEISYRLPLQYFQIDDGFQSRVGDWFHFHENFPQGVAPLAAEITDKGFAPGLWLAPFIVDMRSQIARQHPDWLIRGNFGQPSSAGFLFGGRTAGLDLTHPDALSYVEEVTQTAVQKWGFPYLKLDFLYAAALNGQYQDPTRTRAQILRFGLECIRESTGEDVFIVGCGCPLGSAIGLVDAMRIGPDVDRRWNASFKGIESIFKADTGMPSTRWSIHNAITRSPMHRRWWINDPDCLLVRPTTQLTLAEVQSLATTIALTGGSMFVSDHLPDLPSDRLRIVEVLLPVIDKRPMVMDWFDHPTPRLLKLDLVGATGRWHLLALFNWSDTNEHIHFNLNDFYLDSQIEYIAREFWSGDVYHIIDGILDIESIPPHGVVLLSVRPYRPYQPQYLGSDLHISQGLEISSWKSKPNQLEIIVHRPGIAEGYIVISLPHAPHLAHIEDRELVWKLVKDNIYQFELQLKQYTNLSIRY